MDKTRFAFLVVLTLVALAFAAGLVQVLPDECRGLPAGCGSILK